MLDVDGFGFFGAVHDEMESGGGVAAHQIADDAIGFQLIINLDFD